MQSISEKEKIGNIVIVGTLKNSSEFLDAIFLNFLTLESIFSKVFYIFVENDSKDNTKEKLNNWGKYKDRFKLISFDGLDEYEKNRTIRLEITRNAYISAIKENSNITSNYDYVLIIDMDDISTYALEKISIVKAINFLNSDDRNAAVFANQLFNYYDLWALRHETLCPFDFWQRVLINVLQGKSDQDAFDAVYSQLPKYFSKESKPIKVDSAFGGLGIYKMKYILKNEAKYKGYDYLFYLNESPNFTKLQACEHVSFHLGIKAIGGELYIHPELINSASVSTINPLAYRSLIIK
jgi:hypothetical protein